MAFRGSPREGDPWNEDTRMTMVLHSELRKVRDPGIWIQAEATDYILE
jgi:hypothetical protein